MTGYFTRGNLMDTGSTIGETETLSKGSTEMGKNKGQVN